MAWTKKIYFLTIRRLEAQDVHSFGFFCGLFSWLADGHFLAVSSHENFQCISALNSFLLIRKPVRLGPILITSLELNHLVKDCLLIKSYSELWGIGVSRYELEGINFDLKIHFFYSNSNSYRDSCCFIFLRSYQLWINEKVT